MNTAWIHADTWYVAFAIIKTFRAILIKPRGYTQICVSSRVIVGQCHMGRERNKKGNTEYCEYIK